MPLGFSRTVLVALVALSACKGKADESFVLDNETEVVLTESGGLALLRDGAVSFAMAGPPEARRFTETVNGALGQWTFDRDETTADKLTLDEAVLDGGTLTVRLANGGSLTVSSPNDHTTRLVLQAGQAHDALAIPAACDADGSFHGFGAQYHQTDQRGEAFTLLVQEQGIGRDGSVPFFSGDAHTSYFPMPWYLDGRGFGVLLDTYDRVEVDLCDTDPDRAWLEQVGAGPLTLDVFHGPTPKDVIRQLGDAIGRPTQPPDWAFGTWICTQGGEQAVLDQVSLLEDEGIFFSALWVQDWTGAAENIGGGYGVNYRWEPDDGTLYPDLTGLIDDLHAKDIRVLGYVNPFIDPGLDNHFAEMEAAEMLPKTADGETYLFVGPRGAMTQADLTNPATRAYIKGHLRTAMTDVGLDGWMADFAEWLPLDAVLSDGSDPVRAHNGAPEAWERLTREVMDEARPGDFVMFGRSGWTGIHEVAQIHWIGDQEADFHTTDGLPTVVPAMLNLGLSGQPNVTHDIAGFSGGPSTEELYLRWTELGAFTPFMRTHDGNERDANWRFDTDASTLAHFKRFAAIHEALRPELLVLAADAAATGAPMVRHLMLEYPTDRETWDLADQYLLGPDLLVAPVLHQGMTARDVYLPEGQWFHVWSGDTYTGPSWVTIDAPLGSPPVFSRGADRTDLRAL
ncbi:MAG: hypothetical protein GWP91_19225 [Rhodobacterales bacterium]|nr:hypothetical protein [Rhodobacterales bacterium]